MKKGNRVRFNVGGRIFETTATTLVTAGTNSFFGPLVSDNWNIRTTGDEDDEVFIDRNPDCFAVILDLLRTGELSIPPHVCKDALIREAEYYGVVELVRAASWASPLNGDFVLLSSSITRRAQPSAAKMIFGSPNGGFCVANDTSVHVYDWMLREHPPPIHLDDYEKVNDVLWVGSNNIAIATTETIGMFNAATGKSHYKFVDVSGNQVKGGTCMCLGDSNIFHLYQKDSRAIGMLDLESGKSISSLYLHHTANLSSFAPEILWRPLNLQTVDGRSNCLLATYVTCPSSSGEYFGAQILDTRDNSHGIYNKSWSSRDYNHHAAGRIIRGSTLMEDRNSICVISSNGEIGFLDLRFTGDVQWGSKKVEGCSSRDRMKLAYQSDRIFVLSWKSLLVYSVPDLVMTAQIPTKGGGSNVDNFSTYGPSLFGTSTLKVDDFSISGDKLFMLHRGTNLVEVWETPRPCLTIL